MASEPLSHCQDGAEGSGCDGQNLTPYRSRGDGSRCDMGQGTDGRAAATSRYPLSRTAPGGHAIRASELGLLVDQQETSMNSYVSADERH